MYSEGSRKGTGRCQTAMMCDWRREKDDHDFSKNKEIVPSFPDGFYSDSESV